MGHNCDDPPEKSIRRASSYEFPEGGLSRATEAINQWIGSTLINTALCIPPSNNDQFSKNCLQISKDLPRDPQLQGLLTFLRFNEQAHIQVGAGDRRSIVVNKEEFSCTSGAQEINLWDALSPLRPASIKSLSDLQQQVTGTPKPTEKAGSFNDCYEAWGWTQENHPDFARKRAIFECLLPSYTQAFYRPTFFLELLSNQSGSLNITPTYAWENNSLRMTFPALPQNKHSALYTNQICISSNKLSLTLQGGYTLTLTHDTTHKDLFGLREFLAHHMGLDWIHRYKDKCGVAAGFLAMSIASSAVLGTMTAQFSSIGIALLALCLIVGVAGTATFTAIGGRAFHLLHGPLEKEAEPACN